MAEYFIISRSFAAPFFSDESTGFVAAETPEAALEAYAASYPHPCGLYSAAAYASADAYHKNENPLRRWLCNHEIEKERITRELGAYSYLGHQPGDFEIDGVRHHVESPKQGRVVLP